jgi:hypothetical protein
MAVVAFDTLKLADRVIESGIPGVSVFTTKTPGAQSSHEDNSLCDCFEVFVPW